MDNYKLLKIQCFPFPNEHAARLLNPDISHIRVRRTRGSRKGKVQGIKIPSNISVIWFIVKSSSGQEIPRAQTLRFSKNDWSAEDAKKWLKENNIKYKSFEKAIDNDNKKVRVQATEIVLNKNEILNIIGKKTYNEIKKKDNNPFFQVYSIIQEGLSKPRIIDKNTGQIKDIKPILWLRDTVEKAGNYVKKGLQFFLHHNKDNSLENRNPLGKVVGIASKMIKGKLNQIVIGYFPDKEKVKNLDICSIEADVFVSEKQDINIAKKIDAVSAIALDNSKYERPGFPGSFRLATLQCFEGNQSKNNVMDNDKNKGDNIMTYEEFLSAISTNFNWLKQAVNDKNIFPSQLGFSIEDLRKDFNFKNHFIEHDNFKNDLDNTKKLLDNEKKARQEDLLNNQRITAKNRIETLIPEGFTLKQKNFVLKTFNPEKIEDLSDEGLKKYIDNSKQEFKKFAEVFGVQDDIKNNDDNKSSDNQFSTNNEENVEESILNEILEKKQGDK